MTLQTCLPDDASLLVADTSTIINLNATGRIQEILRALPQKILVAAVVLEELEDGHRRGRRDARDVELLVESGLVHVGELGGNGLSHFEALVRGKAYDTLDDGEAATIALALEMQGVAVIDERKAVRICGERFPRLSIASTIDVLAHVAVQRNLGHTKLANAVYNALVGARMGVAARHISAVVQLIGPSRASECLSLPRSARKVQGPG